MMRLLIVASLGMLASLAALGTGCSQREKLNSVQGKVLYQGQPLAGALVSFHPEAFRDNPPTGFTKEDGTFTVFTGSVEGAKAGTYTITIMCQVPVKTKTGGLSMGGTEETEDRFKGAYATRDDSQIKVTIKEGPNQLEPFDLN
jgi:hypothetical protein